MSDEVKLLDQAYRVKIIQEIKSDENIQRKVDSFKKMNMQNDNFYEYVKEYLESKLDAETVKELHVFANVNLQKRISNAEAGVYKREPLREFYIDDDKIEDMHPIYDNMDVDTILKIANESYKYQDQCTIQVYPEDGCLKPRVMLPHHLDAIPEEKNPERAMGYVISNFDNVARDKIRREPNRTGFSQGDKYRDRVNQAIADYDDSQQHEKDERYYWWSKSFNFVTNGKGEVLDKEFHEPTGLEYLNEDGSPVLDENILSPLFEYQVLPFIDVASKKDFEYWVRSGNSLYDATIMYNTILTSEFQTVEMQGHAQPYYKGDANHLPENMRIGVDKMIFIPVDPENEVNSEFGFANPGSDLAGIREFRESYLNAFLTSRGLDTSIVSGSPNTEGATSGVDRLLQMIEKFESSTEDFALFRKVERQLCTIIAAYIKHYYGERRDGELVLKEDYQINIPDPMAVKCAVEFTEPQMIQSEMEKLDILEKELDLRVTSRVHYLVEEKGLTQEQALEKIAEIDQFELGMISNTTLEVEEDNEDSQEDSESEEGSSEV
jgi:hypothetical protein